MSRAERRKLGMTTPKEIPEWYAEGAKRHLCKQCSSFINWKKRSDGLWTFTVHHADRCPVFLECQAKGDLRLEVPVPSEVRKEILEELAAEKVKPSLRIRSF